MNDSDPTAAYLEAWRLTPEAQTVSTRTGEVTFVRTDDGRAAVLKIALVPEEQRGNALMDWWDSTASAHSLAQLGPAVLLERACGPGSLLAIARDDDDAATRVLAETARHLHVAPDRTVQLVPLRKWFADLLEASDQRYADARAIALRLLDDPVDEVVLHGDVHHENVLDFGAAGAPVWKAIDPKALVGESGFDYANLLCNPYETFEANHEHERLERRIGVVASVTGYTTERLRDWHTVWHALSEIWGGAA
ncbi:aminoglycoside phosphotransferase family protein [Gryllotalpicola reticulitermitis]|uniref:Aminoglycoside phosphotransferase family protein n=1 Tax=Gryllotalpicola reticulitermitis TaxID=1184153 RepID=A0ABV8Q6I6_9MICO